MVVTKFDLVSFFSIIFLGGTNMMRSNFIWQRQKCETDSIKRRCQMRRCNQNQSQGVFIQLYILIHALKCYQNQKCNGVPIYRWQGTDLMSEKLSIAPNSLI